MSLLVGTNQDTVFWWILMSAKQKGTSTSLTLLAMSLLMEPTIYLVIWVADTQLWLMS